MDYMTSEAIYSALRDALCKDTPVPDADWNEFVGKTQIDLFDENDVVVEPGQLSTHSYFIIKGLMMCYLPEKQKNTIMWFRAENEYAFTIDKLDFGEPDRVNEERLIALEDSIVVSITHENLLDLRRSNRRILDMEHSSFMRAFLTLERLSRVTRREPEYSYDLIQRRVTFDLSRVPARYLAPYLGTSVKKLTEIRRALQQ